MGYTEDYLLESLTASYVDDLLYEHITGDVAITDEDVQFVLDLLTKRTLYPLVTTSYKTINSLINEELSAFFAGNVTAEDAARRIQSRVSIYLAEQS